MTSGSELRPPPDAGPTPDWRLHAASPDPGDGDEDSQQAAEQRLKDMDSFTRSFRRRWYIIAGSGSLLLLGWLFGLFPASLITIALVLGGAVALNLLLGTMVPRGWYRSWQIYGLALVDIALVAALVVFFGRGGFIVAFLLAVLPYTFAHGRRMGEVLVAVSALGYVVAVGLHGMWFADRPLFALPGTTLAEAGVFLVVGLVLIQLPARLIERIRTTREVMARAERGYLAVRAPAEHTDELGFLETSFNHMLEGIAATISQVQRETDEVAAFAEVLADAAEQMLQSSRQVADTAAQLARQMGEQRELAETGHDRSTTAAADAEGLRSRAEVMEADAGQLVESADRGRDRVGRASETLLSIGHEVGATASTVQELSGLSERIGTFTERIGAIARRTHLLALNAAIEAAQAEEEGAGFAAVADQVRALAREAGQSAREAQQLVAEVRSGIDAVAQAMATGEAQVRDVGVVADEARRALDDIHAGALQAAELVKATATISRSQAEGMAELANNMSRMAEISSKSSGGADSTAGAMSAQISAMDSLSQTSKQIAALAERLRGSIARFSVLPPEQTTSEHRAISPRSEE